MRAARSSVVVALLIATQGCQPVTAVSARPAAIPVTCLTGTPLAIAPVLLPSEALSREDDDAGSTALHPCTAKAQEHDAATSAVSALGDRIRDLADDARPAPVTEELEALLATPCFQLSVGDPHDSVVFDSAIALKTWWDDGGESWVEHYLALEAQRTTVIAPTPRRTLVTGSSRKHPLAPLLCPASDARSTSTTGCGHETTGWARRADLDFGRRASAKQAIFGGKTAGSCAKEAEAAELVERFSTYRDCLEEVAPRRDALPLGRFKAPADGWFVITGPRARRSGCVEIRTYDLATGAAYITSECTPNHGSRANPAAAPVLSTVTGKLPLPTLAYRSIDWTPMNTMTSPPLLPRRTSGSQQRSLTAVRAWRGSSRPSSST